MYLFTTFEIRELGIWNMSFYFSVRAACITRHGQVVCKVFMGKQCNSFKHISCSIATIFLVAWKEEDAMSG